MSTTRLLAFSIALIALLVCLVTYSQITTTFDAAGNERVYLAAISACLSIGIFLLWPTAYKKGSYIFVVAVLTRIALLPSAPSDDIHRYLWEGKLVTDGISPYASTADDSSLASRQDEHWQLMNHRDKPTAYPPLAQWIFAGLATIHYHPTIFKLAFVAFDLAALAALLALLHHRGLCPTYSVFYALNPIVLLSFAGEAHYDSAMVAFLTFSLLAADRKKITLSAAFAALTVGFKITCLVAVPFLALHSLQNQWKQLHRFIIPFALCIVTPLLYHLGDLSAWYQGLQEFASTRSFNAPVYDLLNRWMGLERNHASLILMASLAVILAWRFLFHQKTNIDTQLRWAIGALLLLSPTNHFWYLTWILPFVALRPSLAWIGLSVTFACYFWVWTNAKTTYWRLLPWQEFIFWSPVAMGFLYEIATRKSAIYSRMPPLDSPPSFSIVIPCHNLDSKLTRCLESIRKQSHPSSEIILVHSDSTRIPDTKLIQIQSERGRGNQIRAGIEQATSSWIVIFHADSFLPIDAFSNIRRCINANPNLVAGSLGQRFRPSTPSTLIIEILNDLRAIFSDTSFGDQVQFVRRDLAIKYDLLPPQPLMEDVELSWRARELGPTRHLHQPAFSCPQKWQKSKFSTRFSLIIRLIVQYRWIRASSRSAATQLSNKLYNEYYPPRK